MAAPSYPYPISGIPTGIHPRRNINDWYNEIQNTNTILEAIQDPQKKTEETARLDELKKQWHLFIQAMRKIQDYPEDSAHPLGWYQMAGIHGAPYIHWMETPQASDRPGDYCAHATALFATWHRPYLLLIEQRVVIEALEIASKCGDPYVKAAQKLRFPFWDWASNPRLPDIINQAETTVLLPTSHGGNPVPQTVRNPLYSYRFQEKLTRQRDFGLLQVKNFVDYEETKRCPDKNGNSQPNVANAQMAGDIVDPIPRLPTNFKNGIYNLIMASDRSYGSFSNKGWVPHEDVKNWLTLENYHDSVHVYVGMEWGRREDNTSRGHMAVVPVSAFDPIFWLHHCNVDRIYALWQSIHYNIDFEEQASANDRLPAPDEASIDSAGTHLRPFYYSPWSEFVAYTHPVPFNPKVPRLWTNQDVQRVGRSKPRVFDLWYSYPEIDVSEEIRRDERRLSIHTREKVEALYGTPQVAPDVSLDDVKDPKSKLSQTIPDKIIDAIANKRIKLRREWQIVLSVKKYLITENFTIFFFLGDPGSDLTKWATHKYKVGVFTTFKSSTVHCSNCASQAESYISGGANITHEIYNNIQDEDASKNLHDEAYISAYLKKNLQWKMVQHGGGNVDLEKVLNDNPDGLKIAINSFFLSRIPNDALDTEGDAFEAGLVGRTFDSHAHLGVTRDKKDIGGLTSLPAASEESESTAPVPAGVSRMMVTSAALDPWVSTRTVVVE